MRSLRTICGGMKCGNRTKNPGYFVCVRDGYAVGPHSVESLRMFMGLRILFPEWFARREDSHEWIPLREIPYIARKNARDYEGAMLSRIKPSWQTEAATQRQVERIKFFQIPFDERDLTKARASILIDMFSILDPDRQMAYEQAPCSEEQSTIIRELGGDPSGLNRADARDEIYVLELEKRERRFEDQEQMGKFMIFVDHVNDPDVCEVCGYEPFTEDELPQVFELVQKHVPNWAIINRFQLGDLIARKLRRAQPK